MKNLRSINETYLFKLYDKTIGLNKTMLQMVQDGVVLVEEDLIDYIAPIERRYLFPLKNETINDFKSGKVKLLYNNKNYRLPNTVPFFLVNMGDSIVCVVNVSNFTTVNKDGLYKIDSKILYSLMQGGTIMGKCYQKFPAIKNRVTIIKIGSQIYSSLFSKIMNKMFSLSITPAKTDIIIFLSSMFFITNMLGRDDESLIELNKKYALDNCKDSSQLLLNDFKEKFNYQEDMKDFETFINSIARNVAGLEELTVRGFTEQYVTSYGANILMGLEYLPIFIHNLASVTVGSFLNNQNYIENIVGRDIDKLIAEFSKL